MLCPLGRERIGEPPVSVTARYFVYDASRRSRQQTQHSDRYMTFAGAGLSEGLGVGLVAGSGLRGRAYGHHHLAELRHIGPGAVLRI